MTWKEYILNQDDIAMREINRSETMASTGCYLYGSDDT